MYQHSQLGCTAQISHHVCPWVVVWAQTRCPSIAECLGWTVCLLTLVIDQSEKSLCNIMLTPCAICRLYKQAVGFYLGQSKYVFSHIQTWIYWGGSGFGMCNIHHWLLLHGEAPQRPEKHTNHLLQQPSWYWWWRVVSWFECLPSSSSSSRCRSRDVTDEKRS